MFNNSRIKELEMEVEILQNQMDLLFYTFGFEPGNFVFSDCDEGKKEHLKNWKLLLDYLEIEIETGKDKYVKKNAKV